MGSARGSVELLGAPSEVRRGSIYNVDSRSSPHPRDFAVGGFLMGGLDLLDPHRRNLFIGGAWRPAEGDKRFDVIDPADGSVLTDVADGSTTDAMAALD